MDAEKIIQDLNRRFAKPLPEFNKRFDYSIRRCDYGIDGYK